MEGFKAGIFDLDGVITKTAALHAKAWKKMFDSYNDQRKEEGKETYKEFSIEEDYPLYLDGVPRYQGVEAFLKSRDIELPFGEVDDTPVKETICGLGNRKNDVFQQTLENEEVFIYQENVNKIKEWRANGLQTAIISSSKNCRKVLEVTGLRDLFDVLVDGVISEKIGLKGKPEPDIFHEAVMELNLKPKDCFIVEDAISGVCAGRTGGFKYVIGINTKGNKDGLMENGADVVLENLNGFNPESISDQSVEK